MHKVCQPGPIDALQRDSITGRPVLKQLFALFWGTGPTIERGTPDMDLPRPRRYLLINPNTNHLTTQRLQDVLLPLLPQGLQLDVRTARFGAQYIACEASHAVAAHACLDAWAAQRSASSDALDGVLIGCFGDPGLFALREASACPVTGLAEASFIQAASHGPFAIVTGGERWKPMLHRLAGSLGFGPQLRHIETVAPTGAALQADPDMALACLRQACQSAAQSGVSSIILGGAGLAGRLGCVAWTTGSESSHRT
eukprot:gene23374-28365_t